jgi:hypothetical protein
MRHIRSILLAVAVGCVATPLKGQTIQSPYEFVETRHSVGAFAGYVEIEPGRLDLAPRSALLFGARYDMRFTGPLSGEVGLAFSPTERTIYRASDDNDGTLVPFEETSTLVGLFEAGLRFHLTGQRTWHNIAPYVVGTGGVVTDLTSNNKGEQEIPTDQFFRFGLGFAAGIGVGSDVFVSDRFSLRVEVRDHLWRLAYPGGISGTGARVTEWTHNFAPSIGGSYHF